MDEDAILVQHKEELVTLLLYHRLKVSMEEMEHPDQVHKILVVVEEDPLQLAETVVQELELEVRVVMV